jgi:hypothetical protein
MEVVMSKLFTVLFFSLLFSSAGLAGADSGAVINFYDGRHITTGRCNVEGDAITYTLPGSNKTHNTNYNEVESISYSTDSETAQTSLEGKSANVSLSEPALPDISQPGSIKTFAKLVYDMFDHEPAFRKALREINRNDKGKQIDPDKFIIILGKKSGYDIMEFYKEATAAAYNLEGEEKSITDRTFRGLAFYFLELPGDEAVKAGIITAPKEPDRNSPEFIKTCIKAELARYGSDKIFNKETAKEEIKAAWNKLISYLMAGDIDSAVDCGSELARGKPLYRKNFEALKEKGKLKKFASGLKEMEVVEVDVSVARGILKVAKKDRNEVFFSNDGEGHWKIDSMYLADIPQLVLNNRQRRDARRLRP